MLNGQQQHRNKQILSLQRHFPLISSLQMNRGFSSKYIFQMGWFCGRLKPWILNRLNYNNLQELKYSRFCHYQLPSKSRRISFTKRKGSQLARTEVVRTQSSKLVATFITNPHSIITVARRPERGLERTLFCWAAATRFQHRSDVSQDCILGRAAWEKKERQGETSCFSFHSTAGCDPYNKIFFPIYGKKYHFSEPPWLHHWTIENSTESLPVLHYLEGVLFLEKQSVRQKSHRSPQVCFGQVASNRSQEKIPVDKPVCRHSSLKKSPSSQIRQNRYHIVLHQIP